MVKTFGTVLHEILIDNLHKLNFGGLCFAIIRWFFTDRNNLQSAVVSLMAGVAQSAILSHFLFNVLVRARFVRVLRFATLSCTQMTLHFCCIILIICLL